MMESLFHICCLMRSSAGIALMMNAHDDFSHEVAAHLQTKDADVRVCNWSTDSEDHSMLPTVTFF